MEGRPNRGRQTSWKRGGGGNDSGASGGEQTRVRGRGRYGTGRGKRDHYRGRGRGGPPATFERGQEEWSRTEVQEEEEMETHTRRKLESNWDRYKESEEEETNNDMPTQRGSDYHVLLESAGDSFTQFRFSEEREWEMDPLAANQVSAVFVDLPALAQTLQNLPLHCRLNLEAELIQVSTPVELPAVTMAMIKPPLLDHLAAHKGLTFSPGISCAESPAQGVAHLGSTAAKSLFLDDHDEELDQLLGLQGPDSNMLTSQPSGVVEQNADLAQGKPQPGETKEKLLSEPNQMETPDNEKAAAPPKTNDTAKEVAEDDLEDWLDSMIS
ncbi:hypothetical protein UPYG_G00350240 [Umbra pygmaea]|uniref:Cell death regulator Aven n=1 Tax=Umbra pygmaea TaxID=75934 RepID=A0ABD0W2R4_UMBPY